MCGSAAVSSSKVSLNQRYVCAAQFMQSFGLGSRYANPYCNNVLYSSIALRYINGVTPPKLQALARRDTPALTL